LEATFNSLKENMTQEELYSFYKDVVKVPANLLPTLPTTYCTSEIIGPDETEDEEAPDTTDDEGNLDAIEDKGESDTIEVDNIGAKADSSFPSKPVDTRGKKKGWVRPKAWDDGLGMKGNKYNMPDEVKGKRIYCSVKGCGYSIKARRNLKRHYKVQKDDEHGRFSADDFEELRLTHR
jgi:hypothetical protein